LKKDLIFSLSLANLCLIRIWARLFAHSRSHNSYFTNEAPPLADYVALICDILLLAGLFWGGVSILRRLKTKAFRTFGVWLFFILTWFIMDALRNIAFGFEQEWARYFEVGYLLEQWGLKITAGILICLGMILLWVLTKWQEKVFQFLKTAMVVLFPLFIFTLAQAFWYPIKNHVALARENSTLEIRARQQAANGKLPRILWVILDELDYEWAFEKREIIPWLPELNRLPHETFAASHAYPPGNLTLHSLPALLTGRLVAGSIPEGNRELLIHFAGEDGIKKWSEQPNVFSETLKLGGHTQLIGWYHPYGRILGRSLNECTWMPEAGYSHRSFLEIMPDYFSQCQDDFFSPRQPLVSKQHHQLIYRIIREKALKCIENLQPGITFLHYPIPHPPYIYDRAAGKISTTNQSEYLDNLVLADKTWGELRKRMEDLKVWNQAMLVLSSDHYWKDKDRYHFSQDRRVPFFIHFPQQLTSGVYDRPFNTLVTKDLILAALRGEISDMESARGWLNAYGQNPPTIVLPVQ
jgi:hypothetical protein